MSQVNFRTSSERLAVIALDDEAWDDFVAALDAPVAIDPAVKARYARKPLWDR